MTNRVHVQLKEDLVIEGRTVVKAGQKGYLAPKLKEVRFPSYYGPLEESKVEELPQLSIEDSIAIIRSYEGHHTGSYYTRGEGKYQFNIKFYSRNVSPMAQELLSDNAIGDAHWDIINHELRCLVDKDYCDGVLSDDFDWIKNIYQEGRLGGWLVLENYSEDEASADAFEARYDDIKSEQERVKERVHDLVAEMVRNVPNSEIVDEINEQLAELDEEKRELEDELESLQYEADSLARDLQLIEEILEQSKVGLAEYMETEECWEMYYEHILQEQEEQRKYNENIQAAKDSWSELSVLAEDNGKVADIMDTLQKVLPNAVTE